MTNKERLLAQLHEKRDEISEDIEQLLNLSGKKFQALRLNDIKALPMDIVCKDYLPLIRGALNIIAGAGGVGKSAVSIRATLHFLRANPKSSALLILGEDFKSEIFSRIKEIGNNSMDLGDYEIECLIERMFFLTVDNDEPMRFVFKAGGAAQIDLSLVKGFTDFITKNNIGFVVLDPLKKFHSVNENDNSEMDVLVRDVFLNMAQKTNIVLVVLHHSAKSLDSRGARGAATITDTARIAYKLSKRMIRDQASGEMIEDPEMVGKIKVTTIKDNMNIFFKYGRYNFINGILELFQKKREETVIEYQTNNDGLELPPI